MKTTFLTNNDKSEIDRKIDLLAERTILDYQKYRIPIVYLNGDTTGISKDDKVTLDYVYQDRNGVCTLKWQGSSSIAFDKKNYTIEFDNAFEAKSGWGSQRKYCLKANWIDASNLRNLFGAALWGSMLKCRTNPDERLASLPNGGAVDGFPVWLMINDEPQGLYTFNIPKEAWMFGMTGSNSGEGFVCAESFNFDTAAQFDGYDMKVEYSAAEDSSALQASFNNLVNACNQFSGEESKTGFEALVDIESVIDYCIFVVATSHFDGISRNYLMGTFDGTKWFISAYDMDQIAGLKDLGENFGWANDWPSFSDFTDPNRLFKIVMTYYADQVKARYKNLRYWQLAYVDWGHTLYNMVSMFPAALANEDFRLWPARPCTQSNNIHQIESYLQTRMVNLDYNVDQI